MRKRRELPRDDFLRRAFADVKPLERGKRRAPPPEPPPARGIRVDPPAQRVRFVLERDDEYVSGYREELGPSALRPLSSPSWQPEAVLDLHGQRVSGLEQELGRELRSFARRGLRRVLLVHGKGLHSSGGTGVLAQAVIDVISEGHAAPFVRALRTAPLRLGGSGALALELDVVRRRSR